MFMLFGRSNVNVIWTEQCLCYLDGAMLMLLGRSNVNVIWTEQC